MPYQPDNGQGNFGAFPGYGGQVHPSQLPQVNNDPRYLQQYAQPQHLDPSNHLYQQPQAFQQQPHQQLPPQPQQAFYQQYPVQYSPGPQAAYLPPQQNTFGQGVQTQPVFQNQYQNLSHVLQQYQHPHPQSHQQSHHQSHPQQQQGGFIPSPQLQNQHLQENTHTIHPGQSHAELQYQLQHQQQQHQQQRYQLQPQGRPIPPQAPPRPSQQGAWAPQTSPPANPVTPRQIQQQPLPQQTHSQPRSLAHVAIPIQRSSPVQHPPQMQNVPKRRRSNDGSVIVVASKPAPQKPSVQHQNLKAPVASSPIPTSSQMPSTPTPSIDYQTVLLSLADEYTNAAYEIAAIAALANADTKLVEEYQSLMATAMGCLETVLKSYRQPDPTFEARIRLRLASLMLEETENYEEIGEVLSKGIALCERNRLVDMKYAMHHLQAQALFRSSPRASLKAIDKLVEEVEALRLIHWIYTFRFLRVSLGLQTNGQKNFAAALKHIASIVETADRQRNVTVQIVAAVCEAIIYLRSDSPDSLEPGQRALAAARTHQLGPEMEKLPQVSALLDSLDVAFHCVHFQPDQLQPRVARMHKSMDMLIKDSGWNKDEAFLVPLGHTTDSEIDIDTAGILRRTATGETALSFRWLTRGQLYTLGYLVSSFASIHNNSGDGMAQNFLVEGLKLNKRAPDASLRSLPSAQSRVEWSNEIHAAFRLQLAFAYCGRSEWVKADNIVQEIRKDVITTGSEDADLSINTLLTYLEGVSKQGLGDLESAYTSYNSPILTFDPTTKSVNVLKDLRALAILNKISIIRAIPKPHDTDEETLLSLVEPYCIAHHNKALVAAYYFVKSLSIPSVQGQIMKTKQFLQQAVNHAKAARSNPLLCIMMNIMTHMYFANIVGEQSEKSGRVGRSLARSTRNRLWLAVADEMLGATLDLCGKNVEAHQARTEGNEAFETLPQSLKEGLNAIRQSGNWS